MKITILALPVIDCSGLMRSPQSDIGILYSILKESTYRKETVMNDFRFFYYDLFYEKYKRSLCFKKEQFYEHKSIISLVKGQLSAHNQFYKDAFSLFNALNIHIQDTDYLVLPISIFEQFSLEYFLSAVLFGYFFKKKYPTAQLIFFGTYRSLYIHDIMTHFQFVDAIVRKGDKNSVLQYIDSHKQESLGLEVQNLTYRYRGEIITGLEKSIDINIDPIPNYSGFDLSVHKQEDGNLVLSYELGQGCRNNCFYCYNLHKGGEYYVKDTKKIIAELAELKCTYKTHLFHFDDNEVNYSNDFLINLSNEMIASKLNIFWTALIIPRELSFSLLQSLYNAGCRQLRFGIESGSQKILDLIGKKTQLDEIESILQHCKTIGISTYASFIVDLPQETNTDIKETMQFIFKNKSLLDNISTCAYNTHLGTFDQRYFKYLLGEGIYNFDRTKRKSPKKILLRKFCDKLGIPDIDVIQFMKHTP